MVQRRELKAAVGRGMEETAGLLTEIAELRPPGAGDSSLPSWHIGGPKC